MSEVLSAVLSCKTLKPCLQFVSLCISFFIYLWTHVHSFHFFVVDLNYHLLVPAFIRGQLPVRSDLFTGNHCIFNPDLDNGTVTVIFAPGLLTALRPLLSLTLCIPPIPIIATVTSSEQVQRNNIYETPYLQLQILNSLL